MGRNYFLTTTYLVNYINSAVLTNSNDSSDTIDVTQYITFSDNSSYGSILYYDDVLQPYLPQDVQLRLRDLLASLPDDLHAVHGDFQMKNVLLCDGEPMLIDMETMCTGQPIFDLQGRPLFEGVQKPAKMPTAHVIVVEYSKRSVNHLISLKLLFLYLDALSAESYDVNPWTQGGER